MLKRKTTTNAGIRNASFYVTGRLLTCLSRASETLLKIIAKDDERHCKSLLKAVFPRPPKALGKPCKGLPGLLNITRLGLPPGPPLDPGTRCSFVSSSHPLALP